MSLSEKIITRVVRKDKEDPFMEHIVKVKELREAVLGLIKDIDKIRDNSFSGRNWRIVVKSMIKKRFGEKLV